MGVLSLRWSRWPDKACTHALAKPNLASRKCQGEQLSWLCLLHLHNLVLSQVATSFIVLFLALFVAPALCKSQLAWVPCILYIKHPTWKVPFLFLVLKFIYKPTFPILCPSLACPQIPLFTYLPAFLPCLLEYLIGISKSTWIQPKP